MSGQDFLEVTNYCGINFASLFCGIFGCFRVVKEFRGIHLVDSVFFFPCGLLGSLRSSRVSMN
jgi:hypothetical protein